VNTSDKFQKIRSGVAHYVGVAPVGCLVLTLLSLSLLTGCSTVTTYKARTTAGPAKPPGYPILVYTEDMTIPRPYEVIGTVSISGGHFTMWGGSADSEMLKVMRAAHEHGADAIQMKNIEQPDFAHANFRLVADLLRYTDTWETIAVSEQAFAEYCRTNYWRLDPIEGVWNADQPVLHRIGIMRDNSKPGRDFVGFILNTENPSWHAGYKKIDIKRGPQAGSYVLDYYLDDFSKRETTMILDRRTTFTLAIPMSDEKTEVISYNKNRYFP